MTILLSDPRVSGVSVRDNGEPLVRIGGALMRAGLATRLSAAEAKLPLGIRLRVIEGHRSVESQQAIITSYSAELRAARPGIDDDELRRLASRFVSPIEVAPHVSGAAIDVTLVDACGDELDLGTAIDATPEQSDGRCYFAAAGIGPDARAHRELLARVLTEQGFVNYPTEWWHWSFGDRYWALMTGAGHAVYGPVTSGEVAA